MDKAIKPILWLIGIALAGLVVWWVIQRTRSQGPLSWWLSKPSTVAFPSHQTNFQAGSFGKYKFASAAGIEVFNDQVAGWFASNRFQKIETGEYKTVLERTGLQKAGPILKSTREKETTFVFLPAGQTNERQVYIVSYSLACSGSPEEVRSAKERLELLRKEFKAVFPETASTDEQP